MGAPAWYDVELVICLLGWDVGREGMEGEMSLGVVVRTAKQLL